MSYNQILFKKKDYAITTHLRPLKALKHFNENYKKIDLVITDIKMPEMTGIKMIEEMKKVKSELKVIFASGIVSFYPKLKPIIEKPFGMKDFQKLVKKELEK